MEHKSVTTPRGNVHYWIVKNPDKTAHCLVFTHGVTADHRMFEKQAEYFESAYTVLVWDVPLHGLSIDYKGFSYKNAAEDLKHILESEKIEKAVLVGMSLGGYPSQEFAYRYPEMTEGLVALDTSPFGKCYYSRFDLFCLKLVKPCALCFPAKFLRLSMAKSATHTKYSYELFLTILKAFTKKQIIAQMNAAYSEFPKENKDVKFNFPVLILLGEYDKTGKVAAYSKAWAKKENYPLHIIKNAAHFSNGDNPEAVNKEIETFIKSL